MLGFSKGFAIILFITFVIWYGSKNVKNALIFVLVFAIIKITWNILTKKNAN